MDIQRAGRAGTTRTGATRLLSQALLAYDHALSAFGAELGAFADGIENRLRSATGLGPGAVDPFGLDPEYLKYVAAFASFLHRAYFRTIVEGIENVPDKRVILVANHSGQIPLDGVMIFASLFLDREPSRIARAMVEKWSQSLPFVSTFFARCGQVVGVPENALRLLEREDAVLVFPEGVRGLCKPIQQRYELIRFGSGFMRLALQTRSPIVPVGVVGAEEQYVSVANLKRAARLLGTPSLPIVPQLLLPGGVLPLPTRYRVYFGEPLWFEGDEDDDDAAIDDKVWIVRASVQSLVNQGLRDRTSLFF